MANVMLTVLHKLGVDDVPEFRRQHRRVRSDECAGHDDRCRGLTRRGRGIRSWWERQSMRALRVTAVGALFLSALLSAQSSNTALADAASRATTMAR